MSITLLELRTQSRQRADQENSDFITDSELNAYINSSIGELRDILVQSYGSNYFTKEDTPFTTVNGISDYALPSDFYKLDGVDAKVGGNEFRKIRKFNFNERNRFEAGTAQSFLHLPRLRYRLIANNIRFSPVPDSGTEVRLWYTPLPTKLVLDADTLDDLNSYAEYVVVDSAIKMKDKEESDTAVLERQKTALKRRIEEASQNRDAGEPESVSDVSAEGDFHDNFGDFS